MPYFSYVHWIEFSLHAKKQWEAAGKMGEALANYQRVFALDIRFQDVSNRVKTLAKAAR